MSLIQFFCQVNSNKFTIPTVNTHSFITSLPGYAVSLGLHGQWKTELGFVKSERLPLPCYRMAYNFRGCHFMTIYSTASSLVVLVYFCLKFTFANSLHQMSFLPPISALCTVAVGLQESSSCSLRCRSQSNIYNMLLFIVGMLPLE